ncbi:hypothetical protein [Aquimarina sp. 433]
MRNYIKISFFTLLILTIIGCQNSDRKEKQLVVKKYGIWNSKNDSISVKLELSRFNSWKDLLKRTDEITCIDSIPKVVLKTNKEMKTVYFRNPCWDRFGCILIYRRNTIEIHNDSIFKGGKHYPLNSLTSILKKDYNNNGANSSYSDSPEKVIIFISYDDEISIKSFSQTLNKLVNSYEDLNTKYDLKIWLKERIETPPPPPPPPITGDI